jgi:urate oxidase
MGRRGGKSRKSTGIEKTLHFSRDGPIEQASNLQGSKTATFGVLSKLEAVHLLYHKEVCFCNYLQPIRSYRCLTWIDYAMTITEGACE